jgi:pimeloyl-ACP methyl ester carboxylesterase
MNWSGKRERISKQFYDEFFTLNLPRALKRLTKPTLVIHGENDEAVPVQCAQDAYALIPKGKKKLVLIKGADHRFKKGNADYTRALIHFLRALRPRTKRVAR